MGAAMTVAVAWRHAIVPSRTSVSTRMQDSHARDHWRRWVGEPAEFEVSGHLIVAPGITRMRLELNDYGNAGCIVTRAGWPTHCLEGASYDETFTGGRNRMAIWELPASIGSFKVPGTHRLPLRPIWPGLIKDTVFWGAIAWLVIAAASRLRRRWRLGHGLCPVCAYDLRAMAGASGDVTCPECATSVPGATLGTGPSRTAAGLHVLTALLYTAAGS